MLLNALVSLATISGAALAASLDGSGYNEIEFEWCIHNQPQDLNIMSLRDGLSNGSREFLAKCSQQIVNIHRKIDSVEDARAFGRALPKEDGYYIGIALLHLDFDMDDQELMSYVGAIADIKGGPLRLFLEFPVIADQSEVYGRNKLLFGRLNLDDAMKARLDAVNDIKYGNANDIDEIDRDALVSVFTYLASDPIALSDLIACICGRSELAEAWARVARSFPFAEDLQMYGAELVFNPAEYFLHLREAGEIRVKLLGTFIPHFWIFQPTEITANIGRELRQFIKDTVAASMKLTSYLEEQILLSSLHLYSLKDDTEMVQLLTGYFLQYPEPIYHAFEHQIPCDSAVWMGPLGIDFLNHFTNETIMYTHQQARRADILRHAILRKDFAFLVQTNASREELRTEAVASRAIPAVYEDWAEFLAELGKWQD